MPPDTLTREILGNLDAVSKWLFYILAAVSLAVFSFSVFGRVRFWRFGHPTARKLVWWRAVVRLFTHVVTQRTLRPGRPAAGIAHMLMFSGFLVLLVGTLLIAVEHYGAAILGHSDGPLFHKGLYFVVYEFTLDTFGLALLAGCGWFMWRRWRANTSIDHGPLDWTVLGVLFALGVTGYFVEGLRILREQTQHAGYSYVGLGAAKMFEALGVPQGAVETWHFLLWWLHAAVALGLIAMFPRTRLWHAIAGVLNVAANTRPLGVLTPISIDQVEETGVVGVGDLQDFSRWQLLQLDACVSCGRCQDACPAHEAGKPLSPRDVVQDVRTHLDLVATTRLMTRQSKDDHEQAIALHSLHGQTISAETLWACTTCHACVDVCPLYVNPLDIITDLRRYLVAEAQLRGAPAAALQKTQRSGNPWGLPAQERLDWARGLDVPTVKDNPDFDVLYWVGCAASYDRRVQKVARSVVKLLTAAKVRYAVLGAQERCTGESARRMGDEFLFQELAQANLDVLAGHDVRKILTHCPHCLNSFRNDYPQFGNRYDVVHHSQYLLELVRDGKLIIGQQSAANLLTFHDPCYLARVNQIVDAPRQLLERAGSGTRDNIVEMPRHGRQTACCGAGGGRMWFDDAVDQRVGVQRVQEALDTRAETVAVACPFCLIMMSDGLAARDETVQVKDIAELLADALDCSDDS